MADIANLQETWNMLTLRASDLTFHMQSLQTQQLEMTASRGDEYDLKSCREAAVRNRFKAMFDTDPALQEQYSKYNDIPEFEEEINKIQAEFDKKIAELTYWETQLNNQITVDSTELEEINATKDSFKAMLSSNIQESFTYGYGS